jgi:hypothetical protein
VVVPFAGVAATDVQAALVEVVAANTASDTLLRADLAASSGAGLVGFTPDGSAATTVDAYLKVLGYQQSRTLQAAQFGILPGSGIDNTSGFALLAAFFRGMTSYHRTIIEFPPGAFFTDSFEIPAPTNKAIGGSFDIRGAGSGETVIVARTIAGSSSVFASVACAFTTAFNMSGIAFQGTSANPLQDGIAFYAVTHTGPNNGGLSGGKFSDVIVHGFTGRQATMRGGAENGMHPFQFLDFDNCSFDRSAGVHFPCLREIFFGWRAGATFARVGFNPRSGSAFTR